MNSMSAAATLASASDLATPPRDVAFDYLKATVVLMVVAHHSCLAYTTFAHFDPANYLNSTAPVVDTARWQFFDYAENFNDVFSCVASCFAFLAFFRGAVGTRRRWMHSLARSAFIIYIVHYVYVVWLQRALMGVDCHASLKFLVVFTGATLFSWLTAQCFLAFTWLRRVL